MPETIYVTPFPTVSNFSLNSYPFQFATVSLGAYSGVCVVDAVGEATNEVVVHGQSV